MEIITYEIHKRPARLKDVMMVAWQGCGYRSINVNRRLTRLRGNSLESLTVHLHGLQYVFLTESVFSDTPRP